MTLLNAVMWVFPLTAGIAPNAASTDEAQACPPLFDEGVLSLDFNPGFLHVDAYDPPGGVGQPEDGLTISSFFNVARNPDPGPPFIPFQRDLVARIEGLADLSVADFEAASVEILTDVAVMGPPRTVWPNEAVRAPDGVFPFEALVIPQGFHPAAFPGRLTVVDLEDPFRTEYVIHQSTQDYASGFTYPGDPNNSPRFYHRALFIDMDGDGLKDIVTVRSGFRVVPQIYPPFGELVYFRNPGEAIDPATPWEEVVLHGGPAAGFLGPDIHLDAHDFEGDGVPEIIATHFFSGAPSGPGLPPPTNGKIAIYGAPVGGTWADVDASKFMLPRVADISTDQGFPFDVQVADLNLDGRADILATNHQPDNCTPATTSAVPGRVYALEAPEDGDLFGSPWTTRILLDDIRPNPSLPPISPPGRLAPGRAQVFWPARAVEGVVRPWVVVGGDEASRVWILRPTGRARGGWRYASSVVFDLNDYYGPAASQTALEDPYGATLSTIGGIAWRYDRPGPDGLAELYIPAFEAMDVHVMSFRPSDGSKRVECVEDVSLTCPS